MSDRRPPVRKAVLNTVVAESVSTASLLAVLALAVARPRRLPEAVAAGSAAVLVIAVGAVPASQAWAQVRTAAGRRFPGRRAGADLPRPAIEELSKTAADELLRAAAERLDRPAPVLRRRGRVEHDVVRAAEDADLLVCARDGDRERLGPRSLGPAARFVVDHAPCPVLVVGPHEAPCLDSLPPPPPHRRGGR